MMLELQLAIIKDFSLLPLKLFAKSEEWPIAGSFVISRGAKTHAEVVVVELSDGEHLGRGECVPYGRYGETVTSVLAEINSLAAALGDGLDRMGLQNEMPPGAARNALDCAFWDLAAKQSGRTVFDLAGLKAPEPLLTAYTISLGTPEKMARDARKASDFDLLKLKLGGGVVDSGDDADPGDDLRMQAVRAARPNARLIADANEAWTSENCSTLLQSAKTYGFELIEQPLAAGNDHILAEIQRVVPVCADESMHSRDGLAALIDRYDAVNIKLDKTGGLTEALQVFEMARKMDFKVMLGCMVCTSLSVAPAFLLGGMADFVDLDGPLLLAEDRFDGIASNEGRISPIKCGFWG